MEAAAGHTPSAAGDNKTIRISNIPITISRTALQAYLGELDKAFGTIAEHSTGLYISLGPDASDEDCQRLQVATVTFSKLADHNFPSVLILGPPGDTFEGVVDTHFRGLTPLNDPKDPVIDIVAVTGLAGHAFGSWRSRVTSEMWLRDLLPKDMEDNGYRARIFTYGYDTKLNGSHSHAGVDHHSKQFLEAVKGARSRNPTRPLILIGHSLGGLVIKEAMIESFGGSSEIENTLRSCAGMLLFSVPHKGLAESGLICMVHGQPNENLVRDLCGNSQFLRCLDQSFGHQMNPSGMGPKIISFYETKDTKTVKEVSPGVWARCEPYVRMVTEQSVMHAVESGQYIPMDADHSSIVKFINRSDPHYQLVRRKLLEIAVTISITQTEPKAQCKERIRICRWLSSGPFDEKHVEVSGKRQENTGGWLLAHHQFISWMDNSGPRLLWGCGIPGAGKTFLSSLVIDVLKTRSSRYISIGVAYVYFDYKDQNQQKPVMILRSLIKQLMTRPHALSFPIPKKVQWLYNSNCAAESTPKLNDLQDSLVDLLKLFTQTFVVFDALDECQEDIRKDLLPLIHWIAGSGTKIFLTSRPYPQDIAISLSNRHVQRLALEAKEEDVVTYIERTIQNHTSARNLIKGNLRQTIISRLVEACKGMFLLVHFYIEDLCQYTAQNEIKRALEGIHSTLATEDALNGTYSRVMKSIRNQHKSRVTVALKALNWLLTARRTLSINDLRMAVRMSGGNRIGSSTLFDETDMPDAALLLSVCCGLVTLDAKSDTIKLAHYSVQEYLEGTSAIGDLASIHFSVALDCLDYIWLSFLDSENTKYKYSREPRGLVLSDYNYAPRYLHTHMQACRGIVEEKEETIEILLKFLRNGDVVAHLDRERRSLRVNLDHGCSPLHEATAWGSSTVARNLLNDITDMPLRRWDGSDMDLPEWDEPVMPLRERDGSTPLHVAARENMVNLVRFWLENGIDVDVMDNYEQTPLHHAIVSRNSLGAAQLLLESGADVEKLISSLGELEPHVRHDVLVDNTYILGLLFQFGLGIDERIFGSTLLFEAVMYGEPPTVEFLLGKGARMGYALHHAAEEGRDDILRVLLNHLRANSGSTSDEIEMDYVPRSRSETQAAHVMHSLAGVDARDQSCRTPLYYAIKHFVYGSLEVIKMLINAGADVNAVHDGASLLLLAAERCDPEAIVLLLSANADIDARDEKGRTPLHWAVKGKETPRVEVCRADKVKALIDAGADVSAVDRNQAGALHLAAQSSNCDVLALLLDAGADINAHCREGQTPLHYVTRGYGQTMGDKITLLLKGGAMVDPVDQRGRTPLMYLAGHHGGGDGAQILIEAGADVNAVDENQMGTLHLASKSGTCDVLALLLDAGADINAHCCEGQTPLHYVVRGSGRTLGDKITLLLKGGTMVDPVDQRGRTPLMYLAGNHGGADGVRILIEAGADVNAVDKGQMGALHIAAQSGACEVLALLLDAGANIMINAHDREKRTPLHYAAMALGHFERRECIRILVKERSDVNVRDAYGDTPLMILLDKKVVDMATPLQKKREDEARILIDAGANVNDVYKNNMSLLHMAVQNGCDGTGLLVLLLDAGADISAHSSRNRKTALHYACHIGICSREEKIRLLVEKGANVNVRDIHRRTPLMDIIINDRDEGAEAWSILIKAGADVDFFENEDHKVSLLHIVARDGTKEALAALLEANADIHVCDINQRTPLHYVCGNPRKGEDKIRLLVEKGARVDDRDVYGNTPLMRLAARDSTKEAMIILLEAGADIDAYDCSDRTPLNIAIERGLDLATVSSLYTRFSSCRARPRAGLDAMTEYAEQCARWASGRKRSHWTAFPPEAD